MNPPTNNISIELNKEAALNLADALDATDELWVQELDEPFLFEDGAGADLEEQLVAVKSTLLKLNQELPKHYPQLSRANRRAKEGADED